MKILTYLDIWNICFKNKESLDRVYNLRCGRNCEGSCAINGQHRGHILKTSLIGVASLDEELSFRCCLKHDSEPREDSIEPMGSRELSARKDQAAEARGTGDVSPVKFSVSSTSP